MGVARWMARLAAPTTHEPRGGGDHVGPRPHLLTIPRALVAALATLAVAAGPAGAVSFAELGDSPFPVGTDPISVALGDFNSDGEPRPGGRQRRPGQGIGAD